MNAYEALNAYYNAYNEDERFDRRHNSVEFLTTMDYIRRYLSPGDRVLEVGAGSGRYSHALARQGHRVDAVELIPRNIDLFREHTEPGEDVTIRQGSATDLSFFEDIVRNNPSSVVIFDEAYVDFGGTSALPLIEKYDNVLIVQTFSKSRAFAGMRIGYAMGSSRLIKYMNDVKYSVNSYTMNKAAIELGLAALSDEAYFKETVAKVIDTRERTKKELRTLGFEVSDSRTNFVFCTHPGKKASEIFERLKEQGIYVRYFNKPRIDDHLRITIGTDEEMDRLCQLLSSIL